jgi:sec-independent protein translocase protein TatC
MSDVAAPAPIMSHIAELRKRLLLVLSAMVVASALAYVFVEDIYGFLVAPLAEAMDGQGAQRLIYTGLTEAFFTYLKVAIFAGVFLSFPVLLFQVWKFIAPGLYKTERNVFLVFLLATPVLFFLGGACVYYLVLPMVWPFFLGFQTSGAETVLPIQLEARVSEYLDLIMTMIFAFGLCFQLPVILSLLARAGIINAGFLRKGRKYAVLIIFILAAFLTPPDVMSQLLLAFPMLVLYEISILVVSYVGKSD